jgi:hypothetical protein
VLKDRLQNEEIKTRQPTTTQTSKKKKKRRLYFEMEITGRENEERWDSEMTNAYASQKNRILR